MNRITTGDKPVILDRLSALADVTRSRILLVLARQELTVSELCAVLQLPQSTVSRHLKVLVDGDWIESRRNGSSHLYRFQQDELDPSARGLWKLAQADVSRTPGAEEDGRRLAGVLGQRRRRSREFFASAAGNWDRVRDEMFGAQFHSQALLALLPGKWVVADLGCGTGTVAKALAPFVRRVIAVDESEAMLDAARERMSDTDNVELRCAQLEALPLEDSQVDVVTLVLALHHVADPAAVLGEATRVLRPEGRLLLVDMLPHERHEYRQEMGHVWMGFSERQVGALFDEAGLRAKSFRPLLCNVSAHGPSLFAADARLAQIEPNDNQPIPHEGKRNSPNRGATE